MWFVLILYYQLGTVDDWICTARSIIHGCRCPFPAKPCYKTTVWENLDVFFSMLLLVLLAALGGVGDGDWELDGLVCCECDGEDESGGDEEAVDAFSSSLSLAI